MEIKTCRTITHESTAKTIIDVELPEPRVQDHKSSVTGVNWNKDRRKWQVLLSINGRNVSFGRYHDKDEAEKVAIGARLEYPSQYRERKG